MRPHLTRAAISKPSVCITTTLILPALSAAGNRPNRELAPFTPDPADPTSPREMPGWEEHLAKLPRTYASSRLETIVIIENVFDPRAGEFLDRRHDTEIERPT